VNNKIDPADDMETIATELALADLGTLAKRKESATKLSRAAAPTKKEADAVLAALAKIEPLLNDGKAVRSADLTDDDKAAIYDCHFITAKPQIYVCNVDEDGMRAYAKGGTTPYIDAVKKRAASEGSEAVVICGKFEAELADISDPAEKLAFLEDLGLKEPGLSALIHAAYKLLGLRTFFTAGADECRAWTIHAGDLAPKAAGTIHTDFEKGFIKAEIYSYDDLLKYGSEAKIKEAGRYRQEGKEYEVQDGDIVFFKFNV
jgi:GTP-binding protein YchF